MIVERWTFQVTPDTYEDALNLAKEGRDDVWSFINCKIFSTNIGPRNNIVIENEFKDFAEREKLAGQVEAKEEWASWLARWVKVHTGQGTNEIWNVE